MTRYAEYSLCICGEDATKLFSGMFYIVPLCDRCAAYNKMEWQQKRIRDMETVNAL